MIEFSLSLSPPSHLIQKNPKKNSQAFAWFSDLLVEHAEMFWSMFACDMERVLAEQPPDTWDSFPLFQILNDYLRMDGKYALGRETLQHSAALLLNCVKLQ